MNPVRRWMISGCFTPPNMQLFSPPFSPGLRAPAGDRQRLQAGFEVPLSRERTSLPLCLFCEVLQIELLQQFVSVRVQLRFERCTTNKIFLVGQYVASTRILFQGVLEPAPLTVGSWCVSLRLRSQMLNTVLRSDVHV